MAGNGRTQGMIGVDKMGAKILFIDPVTYETQKVLDGFQRTVHELLTVEIGRRRDTGHFRGQRLVLGVKHSAFRV